MEALYRKDLPDGRTIWVYKRWFNTIIAVGPTNHSGTYDEHF